MEDPLLACIIVDCSTKDEIKCNSDQLCIRVWIASCNTMILYCVELFKEALYQQGGIERLLDLFVRLCHHKWHDMSIVLVYMLQ